MMWWKAGGGFVECDVLGGGFWKECRCVCNGLAKIDNSLIHRGNYHTPPTGFAIMYDLLLEQFLYAGESG